MRRYFNSNGNSFFILYAIACIVAIAASIGITIAVVNSDLPDWLKFLILK